MRRSRIAAGLIWLGLGLLGVGCQSTKVALMDPILGPSYQPGNVFLVRSNLPPTFRRVAVLPLITGRNRSAEAEMLEPVLLAELAKAKRFELVTVRPEDLRAWTGRETWSVQEELPEDLLATIAERAGCDGVLFPDLSQFRAYPPMLMGWRLALVDAKSANVLWSVDEVFDAGDSAVVNGARRYSNQHLRNQPALEDSRSILLSPTRFGSYTAQTVLATLPGR